MSKFISFVLETVNNILELGLCPLDEFLLVTGCQLPELLASYNHRFPALEFLTNFDLSLDPAESVYDKFFVRALVDGTNDAIQGVMELYLFHTVIKWNL